MVSRASTSPTAIPSHAGSLLKYFLFTFAVTWACWVPVAIVPAISRTPLRAALLYLGVFAPSFIALWLTRRVEGGIGVRALVARIAQWRVPLRWYAFAIFYIAAVKIAVAILHRLTIGAWPAFAPLSTAAVIPFAIAISTPVQAGEELGWRGYALPRMTAGLGLARASILLGIIWATWHLPLFFVPETNTYRLSFPVYLLQVTALNVAVGWLWEHTNRSLLLVMLMHAAANNSVILVPPTSSATTVFGLRASAIAWLMAAVLWTCALYFIVRLTTSESSAQR